MRGIKIAFVIKNTQERRKFSGVKYGAVNVIKMYEPLFKADVLRYHFIYRTAFIFNKIRSFGMSKIQTTFEFQ